MISHPAGLNDQIRLYRQAFDREAAKKTAASRPDQEQGEFQQTATICPTLFFGSSILGHSGALIVAKQ